MVKIPNAQISIWQQSQGRTLPPSTILNQKKRMHSQQTKSQDSQKTKHNHNYNHSHETLRMMDATVLDFTLLYFTYFTYGVAEA